ncbi:MAG: hypothetical protein B7C24_08900 [Bacteroidetes bacterium 4572_77]|nr:MAG: hypothetical protein B7C24_08900 [Bacteroidetes bacterium 4572_77]
MKKLIFYSFIFLLFFSGGSKSPEKMYKPIYVTDAESKTVSYKSPREMKDQGKIYIIGNYIFIGDVNKGVHVIDNANPESPQKIGFIQIYGNHDIAIKDNVLYADNFSDFIAVDISNFEQPVVTKRVKDVYNFETMMYPPNVPNHTYFECVDPGKGIVVGWEEAELDNPECYTNGNLNGMWD